MENFTDLKFILDGFLFVISGILVMWMAAGFAMLEAGLTRTKNNATVLTKNIALFAISCIMYYFIGYPLMYGDGGAFMGSISVTDMTNAADAAYPVAADFFFQVMFVATAASVISGTVAERMKLWPFLIFVVVLSGIIYPIQGHWTWGGSELGGLLAGFSDFAGSTIVHSVGGWAALAGVLILGARKGKYTKDGKVRPIPGSNLTLATLGTFILWMGWFGFNGGSQLALGSKDDITGIAMVVANTNMAAAAGAVMAALMTQFFYKKVDLTMVLNGALAGLVSVTAAPDAGMMYAFGVGIVGGLIVVLAVPFFDKLRIDDPVGALSVHLVAGIWGTLAVGLFTESATFMAQLKGVVVIGLFVFIVSFIIWKVIDVIAGLRVDEETEIEGLDISETGLEKLVEIAKKVGGENHRFKYIQTPFNMAKTTIYTQFTQKVNGEDCTLLQAAHRLGIGVISSSSLLQMNLFKKSFSSETGVVLDDSMTLKNDIQLALQFVRSTPGIVSSLFGSKVPVNIKENCEISKVKAVAKNKYDLLYRL